MPVNTNNLIWAILGVLLIICAVIFILPHFH